MNVNIELPTSWSTVPYRYRLKYLSILISKGEVAAALYLAAATNKKAYKKVRAYGTEDDIAAIIDAVSHIDDTEPIISNIKSMGSMPSQYLEHTPFMIFAKCDEIYGYMRAAVDAAQWDKLEEYSYQLLRAVTYSGKYAAYDQYVKQPLPKRQQKRLRKYLPVSNRYFTANKVWIHTTYGGILFTGGGEQREKGLDLGWHGTAMSVAESGTFGTLEKVYQTDLHTILLYLVKKKQEADEANSKIKK